MNTQNQIKRTLEQPAAIETIRVTPESQCIEIARSLQISSVLSVFSMVLFLIKWLQGCVLSRRG